MSAGVRVTVSPTDRKAIIDGIEFRVWEGRTQGKAIPLILFVYRVANGDGSASPEMAKELGLEIRAPVDVKWIPGEPTP